MQTIKTIIGFSILGLMAYGMATHTLITLGICTIITGILKLGGKLK